MSDTKKIHTYSDDLYPLDYDAETRKHLDEDYEAAMKAEAEAEEIVEDAERTKERARDESRELDEDEEGTQRTDCGT